jgi:hypothetical protein
LKKYCAVHLVLQVIVNICVFTSYAVLGESTVIEVLEVALTASLIPHVEVYNIVGDCCPIDIGLLESDGQFDLAVLYKLE